MNFKLALDLLLFFPRKFIVIVVKETEDYDKLARQISASYGNQLYQRNKLFSKNLQIFFLSIWILTFFRKFGVSKKSRVIIVKKIDDNAKLTVKLAPHI